MSPALEGGFFTTSTIWEAHIWYESESESEVAQSCPTLCDPIDCSLPGSSIHGIFQARILEWGAIAFSEVASVVSNSVILWLVACQVPLPMGFSRQEYWNGLPCPPPGGLPDPGIKPASLMSPALEVGFFTTSTIWEAHIWYESESEVAQSCLTLCDPMDCCLSGSSVHGIFQAIVLEWIAIFFSRGSSRPRDGTQVSRIVD